MTRVDLRERVDADFWLEGFRDFLALESGNSVNTVEAYIRDVRRLGEFAESKGVRDPADLRRNHLRDHVYLLKDLGPQRRNDSPRGLLDSDLLSISCRRGPA